MIEFWEEMTEFQNKMQHAQPNETWTDEQRTAFASELALGTFMEVAEMTDSFKWKPWRPYEKPDIANLEREIVDICFFLHHIAEAFKISNQDLRMRFKQVMDNNNKRYVEGDFSGEKQ
jgi:hypothetical protein